MNLNLLYREIPKVDVLLEKEAIKSLIETYSYETVIEAVRSAQADLRQAIKACQSMAEGEEMIASLLPRIEERVRKMHTPNMTNVVNATGTILHTNLGRSPISRAHMAHVAAIATGYSNLEYNLSAGQRGERYAHFEELLCKITGAEAAMAVNNNAAAVMLVLNTMGCGGEVIVSRGELVEIGGKFRVPDVMAASGASLVEVGTTNKTHFTDYETAVTEDTKALLKVHTSNYRIVGFTDTVSIEELSELSKKHDLPLIEDIGSGVLVDLSKYGLTYEPTVQASIKKGADVVCFSGDKLLGGPQAGIIVGKKKYIDAMKKNQLTRALRIDKFTAATLEVVLMEYLSEEKAVQNLPVLKMMTEPYEAVKKRADRLKAALRRAKVDADIKVIETEAQIGGGSLPLERIKSAAVSIKPRHITTAELERRMRHLEVPIIGQMRMDQVILDLRTVDAEWQKVLVKELREERLFKEEK